METGWRRSGRTVRRTVVEARLEASGGGQTEARRATFVPPPDSFLNDKRVRSSEYLAADFTPAASERGPRTTTIKGRLIKLIQMKEKKGGGYPEGWEIGEMDGLG